MKMLFFTCGIISFVTFADESSIINGLNERYANTTETCEGGKPAYYCSGVLIRGTANTASETYKPWEPSDHAIKLGSTSFSFLRKDITIRKLYRTNGFLFNEQSVAEELNVSIPYRCSFPYEADSLARPGYGCFTPPPEYAASCGSLGVHDLSQWLEYMPKIDSKIEMMCSFSTDDPASFFTSIQAHDAGISGLDPAPNIPDYGDYNEVLLKTWELHQALPLEAFWFIEGDDGAKIEALNDREVYYSERGIRVPVVSVDLENSDSPFVSEY